MGAYRDALGSELFVASVPGGHNLLWDAFAPTAAFVNAFLASSHERHPADERVALSAVSARHGADREAHEPLAARLFCQRISPRRR